MIRHPHAGVGQLGAVCAEHLAAAHRRRRRPPPASMTTTRSTRESASSRRCSTRISVAPSRSSTRPGRRAGRRRRRGRGWRSVRRGAAAPAEGRASRPGPGAAARRRTGRASGGRAEYGKSTASRAASTRCQMPSVGTQRFSRPKATSSPARPMTICDSGSWNRSPDRVASRARVDAVDEERALGARAARRVDQAGEADSRVDLPAPDVPSSSTRSPASMVRSRPRSAQSRRPGVAQAPAARLDPCRSGRLAHGGIVDGRRRQTSG